MKYFTLYKKAKCNILMLWYTFCLFSSASLCFSANSLGVSFVVLSFASSRCDDNTIMYRQWIYNLKALLHMCDHVMI